MINSEIINLRERILSMAAAIKSHPNAHNIAILNRACAQLLEATGEVFSCGSFVKVN